MKRFIAILFVFGFLLAAAAYGGVMDITPRWVADYVTDHTVATESDPIIKAIDGIVDCNGTACTGRTLNGSSSWTGDNTTLPSEGAVQNRLTSGTVNLGNKTIRTTADGGNNTIQQRSYLIWTNPSRCDEGNATMQTGVNSDTFGLCQYSATASYGNNYAIYRLPIPPDVDVNQDWKVEQFGIRLGNADTNAHCYKIEAAVVTPSSPFGPTSFSNTVNLPFTADASGASGDFESVTNVTLTNWKAISGIGTAGNRLVIKVGRDGGNEGASCTAAAGSTVASFGAGLIVSYGSTQ